MKMKTIVLGAFCAGVAAMAPAAETEIAVDAKGVAWGSGVKATHKMTLELTEKSRYIFSCYNVSNIEPGDYRVEATVTVSTAAELDFKVMLIDKKNTAIASQKYKFEADKPQTVSMPFKMDKKGSIRVAGVQLQTLPVGTRYTIDAMKIFKVTK